MSNKTFEGHSGLSVGVLIRDTWSRKIREIEPTPEPILTVMKLLKVVKEQFLYSTLTYHLVEDIEKWRREVAPDLPAHFEGVYRQEQYTPWPRRNILTGVTLVVPEGLSEEILGSSV